MVSLAQIAYHRGFVHLIHCPLNLSRKLWPRLSKMSSVSTDVKLEADSKLTFQERIVSSRLNVGPSVADFNFNKKRIRVLSTAKDMSTSSKGIVYWMFRDQRVEDNWALLYAQRLALKAKVPLHVVHCLIPEFLEATIRHYKFAMSGLNEVQSDLKAKNISFHLLIGMAPQVLPQFVINNSIGTVICEFFPLRTPKLWVDQLLEKLPNTVPLVQVDAHNIVPCWEASDKQEYAARTIRNKINRKLEEFLTHFPPVIHHPYNAIAKPEKIDWQAAEDGLKVDRTVQPVTWARPGTRAGLQVLEEFCEKRLKGFSTARNDPNKDVSSNLSPWFHFGQVSVQRAVLEVKRYKSKHKESVDAFCEEAIVRRELSDNFCHHNVNYDKLEGGPNWAQLSLKDHSKDKRDHLYSEKELRDGLTYDKLWNASQKQLVNEGKIHGFLRMYWAKKILEWTKSPEEALRLSILFNDKYSLDGRDPNGYVGCMWSIVGVHDMGWKERPVFGKIRFMNYNGCKRKFDVAAFEHKYNS